MTGQNLARIGAIVFVAVVVTAAAMELAREEEAPAASNAQVAPQVADPLRADLIRCQELGEDGPRDAVCLKAWAESRRRFLGEGPRPAQQRNTTIIRKNSVTPSLPEESSVQVPTTDRSQ